MSNNNLGHWELTDELIFDNKAFGFIYQITNIRDGRIYIGKKQMLFKKRKTLKHTLKNGSIRRVKKVVHEDSDWREYTGSSDLLNKDIAKLGKQSFKFEILKFGYSKWQLAYDEAEMQFELKVLKFPKLFYNRFVGVKLGTQSQ